MYMYAHFLCGGCYIRICPTETVACARVCVSCVEGGVCVCVLPKGWHVRVCVSWVEGGACVCVLPRGWHVRWVCVSRVEGGVCVCVLPRGWHVHVCVFPMYR